MINYRRIITLIFIVCAFFSTVSSVRSFDYVGTWSDTTKLPYPLANHPVVSINNRIIINGGSTTFVRSEILSSLISPGGSLSNWNTESIHLPNNIFWHSSLIKDNYIYIIGGAIYPGSLVNSINYVFRGTISPSGNITALVNMSPLPNRLAGGSAVLVGNKIYYSGGGTWTNGGDPILSNKLYISEIDASGNLGAWQTSPANLPQPVLQHTLIETGKKLIVIGGTTAVWSSSDKVYSADINPDGSIGTWTEITKLKHPNRYPMINKINNIVIVAGGTMPGGIVTDEVYYSEIDASGNTGEWILSPNKLPRINCCTGSTIWNNYMYITGGHNGTGGANNYYDTVVMAKIDLPVSTPTPVILPTSTPTPPTPIVFLPGLGASFNFKEMFQNESNPDGWIMTPGVNVYNNLLKMFEAKDYFWTFLYDWRKPVLENGQSLNDFIKNKVKPWNNKVYLIGHSLGGLISRTCIQKTENNCYAEKLITVGSPHSGAVEAYPALEGGEIWKTGPARLGYELLIYFNHKWSETRRETIARLTPVLKDLLPNFDYLTKNGVNLPPAGLSITNTLLPELQDMTLLENKTTTIFGRNFETVESIKLTNPDWFNQIIGNWPDGQPLEKIPTMEGDGSVLTKSAVLSSNIESTGFDFDHSGIISKTEPLQKILEKLGFSLTIPQVNTIDANHFLVFFVHSPVKLKLSVIPPESFLDDEIIIIPNPESKNYELGLEGTGNGNYQLSVGQIYNDSVFWSDYFGVAKLGETKTFTFSINPQNPKTEPLIDTGGNPTKYFVSSLIKELMDEVYKLGIEKNKQDLLIVNLVLIKPSSPESSLTILGAFRNLIAMYEKNNIISSERAEFFRNRSSALAKYLEFLAFLSPKATKKNIAQSGIASAKKAQSAVKINKLSKSSIFVYLEAGDKLKNAESNFLTGLYYQAKLFSLEAKNLFSETKNIK